MFFENSYIHFSPKLIINSISNYRNIMTKFINKYIEINTETTNNLQQIDKAIISDAIIYSKYYLFYKTKNCIYGDEIMEVILNIEYNLNK
jgi:hypothetical protein